MHASIAYSDVWIMVRRAMLPHRPYQTDVLLVISLVDETSENRTGTSRDCIVDPNSYDQEDLEQFWLYGVERGHRGCISH